MTFGLGAGIRLVLSGLIIVAVITLAGGKTTRSRAGGSRGSSLRSIPDRRCEKITDENTDEMSS